MGLLHDQGTGDDANGPQCVAKKVQEHAVLVHVALRLGCWGCCRRCSTHRHSYLSSVAVTMVIACTMTVAVTPLATMAVTMANLFAATMAMPVVVTTAVAVTVANLLAATMTVTVVVIAVAVPVTDTTAVAVAVIAITAVATAMPNLLLAVTVAMPMAALAAVAVAVSNLLILLTVTVAVVDAAAGARSPPANGRVVAVAMGRDCRGCALGPGHATTVCVPVATTAMAVPVPAVAVPVAVAPKDEQTNEVDTQTHSPHDQQLIKVLSKATLNLTQVSGDEMGREGEGGRREQGNKDGEEARKQWRQECSHRGRQALVEEEEEACNVG